MNRVIRRRDLNAIYVTGPGHGVPGLVANAYLEGTYSEVYSPITPDRDGLRALFRQFSFPGGIPSPSPLGVRSTIIGHTGALAVSPARAVCWIAAMASWTGPKEVDGLPVEGTFRAHQVPLAETRTNPAHRAMLEQWLHSHRPRNSSTPPGP